MIKQKIYNSIIISILIPLNIGFILYYIISGKIDYNNILMLIMCILYSSYVIGNLFKDTVILNSLALLSFSTLLIRTDIVTWVKALVGVFLIVGILLVIRIELAKRKLKLLKAELKQLKQEQEASQILYKMSKDDIVKAIKNVEKSGYN